MQKTTTTHEEKERVITPGTDSSELTYDERTKSDEPANENQALVNDEKSTVEKETVKEVATVTPV